MAGEGKDTPDEESEASLPPVFATTSSADCPSVARVVINMNKRIKQVVWHAKGDYFATVASANTTTSVLIHRLSRAQSFSPFTKSKVHLYACLSMSLVCHSPNYPLHSTSSTKLCVCACACVCVHVCYI